MTPHDTPETKAPRSAAGARETASGMTGDLARRLAALPPPAGVEARDVEPLPQRPGL